MSWRLGTADLLPNVLSHVGQWPICKRSLFSVTQFDHSLCCRKQTAFFRQVISLKRIFGVPSSSSSSCSSSSFCFLSVCGELISLAIFSSICRFGYELKTWYPHRTSDLRNGLFKRHKSGTANHTSNSGEALLLFVFFSLLLLLLLKDPTGHGVESVYRNGR